MSAAKDVSKAIPRFFKYTDRWCPACGKPQTYDHKSSGRYIFQLDGTFYVESQTVYCENGRCPLVREPMHPPEEWAMAPPGERFGTDVLAKVGLLHFRDKLTRAAIAKRLFDEDGLQISERQVNRYFNLYGALV